jgi:hypothetical protein
MTLGGKRMKPLGRMQWAGILLAGASVVLSVLSLSLMEDAQSPTAPLKWWLLAGIVGLLGSSVWVQCTWEAQRGRT